MPVSDSIPVTSSSSKTGPCEILGPPDRPNASGCVFFSGSVPAPDRHPALQREMPQRVTL